MLQAPSGAGLGPGTEILNKQGRADARRRKHWEGHRQAPKGGSRHWEGGEGKAVKEWPGCLPSCHCFPCCSGGGDKFKTPLQIISFYI